MSAACIICGDAKHTVELTGMIIANRYMCYGCFIESPTEISELCRQFQFLLDNGVSRARANKIIIERIEKMPRKVGP